MRSRLYSDIATPIAADSPAMESANPNGGEVGGESGQPLTWANPLAVSATVPKPGRLRLGPVCPKPDTRASTNPGLSALSTS